MYKGENGRIACLRFFVFFLRSPPSVFIVRYVIVLYCDSLRRRLEGIREGDNVFSVLEPRLSPQASLLTVSRDEMR